MRWQTRNNAHWIETKGCENKVYVRSDDKTCWRGPFSEKEAADLVNQIRENGHRFDGRYYANVDQREEL